MATSISMKNVLVIGAGAAGIAALRSLAKHQDKLKFTAYETSDRVGGTWIHNDKYKPTSMYDNLRTNLPKEVMAFPDLPFSADINESYVSHDQVLQYLDYYAQHYDLTKFVKFRHTVTMVQTNTKDDMLTPTWKVTVRDDADGQQKTEQFDAVMVCNGHYTIPYVPDIEGISVYEGESVHSHYYRSPEPYRDKSVLVLGAGPSGTDIALDLSPYASQVYLAHNKERLKSKLPDNVEEVTGIRKLNTNDIELMDGRVISADVIVFATGYKYEFPFLSESCHPTIRNEHVTGIYRMLVDIEQPSLFYVGLNKSVVPFPHFYIQTEYATSVILGQVTLPTKEEMRREHDSLYKRLVIDMNRREKDFHFVKNYQWEYNKELVSLAGNEPLNQAVEDLYNHCSALRHTNLCQYKSCVYKFSEPGKFDVVSESTVN